MSKSDFIETHPLREGEEVRVEVTTYRGRDYASVRRWYRDGDEWKPGKGATLNVALVPFLRRALERAEAHAIDNGLLDPEAYESLGEPVPAAVMEAA